MCVYIACSGADEVILECLGTGSRLLQQRTIDPY